VGGLDDVESSDTQPIRRTYGFDCLDFSCYWLVQFTAPANDTVGPDTVHVEVVSDWNVTRLPKAPPVPERAYVGPPTVALIGTVEVTVTV
jgi:hypothetical protein